MLKCKTKLCTLNIESSQVLNMYKTAGGYLLLPHFLCKICNEYRYIQAQYYYFQ